MIKLVSFILCMTGPVIHCAEWSGLIFDCELSTECQRADYDRNGFVDMVDFGLWQAAWSGGGGAGEQGVMTVTTWRHESSPWYDEAHKFFGTPSELLAQQDLYIGRPIDQRDCQFLDGAESDRQLRVVVPCYTVRSVGVRRAYEAPDDAEK